MKKTWYVILACLAGVGCETTRPGISDGSLLRMNEERIVSLASAAVRDRYPGIRLSDYALGQIVCIHYPSLTPSFVDTGRSSEFSSQESMFLADRSTQVRERILVDWLGTDTIEIEKGKTAAQDRKKVKKIRVELTREGKTIGVSEGITWLRRFMTDKGYPQGVKEESIK